MTEINTGHSKSGYIHSTEPTPAHIKQATSRFLVVNEGRIRRVREGLQPKQQQCFDLLAFLFHVNKEGLPGYVSHQDVPTGIANYHPEDSILKLAQSLNRQAVSNSLQLSKPQLSAIYLMGSSGSIGQSTTSDLDIWICYSANLSNLQIELLDQKSKRLSEWAKTFNLEVHFFLMEAHRFDGGDQQSLTGENCGSTQHVLLLDEFYRTAQLLAGNIPAWWLVPADHENNYAAELQKMYDNGLIAPNNCTDFGALATLPAARYPRMPLTLK